MVEAKDVRVGEWVLFNREPYKVKRRETVTAGTHMHSKIKFIMAGLFSPGEKSAVYSHHDRLELAELEFKSGQVISLVGNKCQIMDSRSYEIVDAEISPESEIREGMNVLFVYYNGKNIITGESR
ncbi:hypothetical protein HYY72_04800 [Candidatus Woesearchaeota archaeon]|nr:hypothetical protein [Candidatus Woesearchaeota archaeon]